MNSDSLSAFLSSTLGKITFFSYEISSWMKRATAFRKVLSTGRGFDFLGGDKLQRSLYVRVSLIEDRKKTEEMATLFLALLPQRLRLR